MKILSFITTVVLAIAGSFTPVQADDNLLSLLEGIETTVIQCGVDPGGKHRCVITVYNDDSACVIVDNEGAPSGVQFFYCD
jgi:hypothetical protein